MQNIENIKLTPVEKELYEKCLLKYPDMTILGFKEIRQNAIKTKDPGVRTFYLINGILSEERPDRDTIKEWKGKN